MPFKDGNIPHNKGKTGIFHHTEEFKQKMSESTKKRDISYLYEHSHPAWNKGKTGVYSEEVIEEKRLQMIGNQRWLGRKHTEEEKQKISSSNMGKSMSKESIEKKKKTIELRKDIIFSPERRRKIGENSRKVRLGTIFPQKDTDIEKILHNGLDKLGVKYVKHITVCDICQPDIVFPEKKLAVFADGDYWHSKTFDGGKAWKKDRNQDRVLTENGWKVLRFWGKDIKSNPDECINKIIQELM